MERSPRRARAWEQARGEAQLQVERVRAEAQLQVEQVRAEAHAQAEQSRAETTRVSEAIKRDAEERVARELARVEAFWGVLGRAELRAQTAEAAAEASSSHRVAAIEGMLARAELRARTAEAAAEASSPGCGNRRQHALAGNCPPAPDLRTVPERVEASPPHAPCRLLDTDLYPLPRRLRTAVWSRPHSRGGRIFRLPRPARTIDTSRWVRGFDAYAG